MSFAQNAILTLCQLSFAGSVHRRQWQYS